MPILIHVHGFIRNECRELRNLDLRVCLNDAMPSTKNKIQAVIFTGNVGLVFYIDLMIDIPKERDSASNCP